MFDGFADLIVQGEGNPGTLAHAPPLQFQADFQKEKLFKDQPPMSWGAQLRQVGQDFSGLREMHLLKRRAAVEQLHTPAERGWKAVWNFRGQILKRSMDHSTK